MISIIAPPANAPQILASAPAPPVPPRLTQQDVEIVTVVREQGPVGVWPLLHRLTDDTPGSRNSRRELRLALWERLRRLLRLRLVFRAGQGLVGINPPPARAASRPRRRRSRHDGHRAPGATVSCSPRAEVVSTHISQNPVSLGANHERVEFEPTRREFSRAGTGENGHQIETAVERTEQARATDRPSIPTRLENAKFERVENQGVRAFESSTDIPQTRTSARSDEITYAARALARLPRRPKRRWSGWLRDWHGYRDQNVVTPDGTVWFLYGALRGQAIITPERGKLPGGWGDGPFRWAVVPASQVRPYLNPAAQLLGRTKLGRKERPSALKAEAARRNGMMPCREGKRRGRRSSQR